VAAILFAAIGWQHYDWMASMSEQPKKRAWCQIHLSTAIVMTFVAGALIWSNTRDRDSYPLKSSTFNDNTVADIWDHRPMYTGNYFPKYGFPFIGFERIILPYGETFKIYFRPKMILLDIIVWIALLATVGFVCEWWIRRRTSSKDRPQP
jgi:hypothetical protein